jgi:hypothetical protein
VNTELTYLLEFLQDEFRGAPVRVRPAPTTIPQKSPDLEQDLEDFEPPAAGIYARVGSRDYFFPVTWVKDGRFSQVQALVHQIRERLDGTG